MAEIPGRGNGMGKWLEEQPDAITEPVQVWGDEGLGGRGPWPDQGP
jgi:hypothetical protein